MSIFKEIITLLRFSWQVYATLTVFSLCVFSRLAECDWIVSVFWKSTWECLSGRVFLWTQKVLCRKYLLSAVLLLECFFESKNVIWFWNWWHSHVHCYIELVVVFGGSFIVVVLGWIFIFGTSSNFIWSVCTFICNYKIKIRIWIFIKWCPRWTC